MKTKICLSPKELKNSEFRRFNIDIRLDDECRNGHEDFAITAKGWYKDSTRFDADCGGCMHDEILALRPDLKIFIDLHLNSSKGVPMYAIENGFYYLQEGNTDALYNHLQLTSNDELNQFKNCPDKLYFQRLIEKLGLPTRWQNKANEAIKILEKLTGQTYVDHSTKETFIFLTPEQLADISVKEATGYYSESEINQRKQTAIKEAKDRKIQDLKNEAAKKIKEINLELQIKLFVLNHNIPIDNMIFYNHTKQLVFNWQEGNYSKRITEQQFASIKKSLKNSSLYKNADIINISCK